MRVGGPIHYVVPIFALYTGAIAHFDTISLYNFAYSHYDVRVAHHPTGGHDD